MICTDVSVFTTTKTDKYNLFRNIKTKQALEGELSKIIRDDVKPALKSAMLATHPILDSNKTQRAISLRTDDGSMAQIGTPTNQLLIGVFFKNVDLGAQKIQHMPDALLAKIRQRVRKFLCEQLNDQSISEKELYGELKELD